MKILYLAPDVVPAPKGAAVRIGLTIATLRALGHEVEVLTLPPPPSPPSPDPPAENFLSRMLRFRDQATAWLEPRRADLVQFRGLWEGVPALEWARRHRVPAVFEAHGFPSLELPYHFPALARAEGVLQKLVSEELWVVGGVRHLIVPSRTTARYLQRLGVPTERVSVVPNAVEVDLFRPPLTPPPAVPPLRLLYQGTLSPWQGLETLLEALSLLKGHGLVELHVVGPAKAAWRARLRAVARALRVHHALHLSPAMERRDLVPVMQSAHICVAPLPNDARNVVQGCCPIKLLEYMAAGRPILSTAIPPVEELLQHGQTAHLVRPGSAFTLADGLAYLMDRPEEREVLGARAREVAVARFTIDHFQERLVLALERARGLG
jgi:glycosyltransferase involved in cell wall biosynthesis